jgi:hypothetical protein
VVTILLSLFAAALMIRAGATRDDALLDDWVPWLWRSAAAIAGVLTVTWLLPLRRRARRAD